jgi:hypothetical protein
MIVAESFLRMLIMIYGKQIVYSDGGTWYPEECISLGPEHRLHSPYEKSIVRKLLILFVFMYNSVVKYATKFANLRRWKYLS